MSKESEQELLTKDKLDLARVISHVNYLLTNNQPLLRSYIRIFRATHSGKVEKEPHDFVEDIHSVVKEIERLKEVEWFQIGETRLKISELIYHRDCLLSDLHDTLKLLEQWLSSCNCSELTKLKSDTEKIIKQLKE